MSKEVKFIGKTEKRAMFENALRSTGRAGIEDLLMWLDTTDFFEAPASTRFHGSYECGLLDHSLDVYRRLTAEVRNERKMVKEMMASSPSPQYAAYAAKIEAITPESIIIVALLHDICKAEYYESFFKNEKTYDYDRVAMMKIQNPREVKSDQGGEFIWDKVQSYKVNEAFPFGHGEKSVYLAMKYIKLTDDEAMAIRAHMGDYTSISSGYSDGKIFGVCPLALLLHNADEKANYLDQNMYS